MEETELTLLAQRFVGLLGRVAQFVEELDEKQLEWRTPGASGDSIRALAVQILVDVDNQVLGTFCRTDPGNVIEATDRGALVAGARRLAAEIVEAMSKMPASDADRQIRRRKSSEIASGRRILVDALSENTVKLGRIELSQKLIKAAGTE